PRLTRTRYTSTPQRFVQAFTRSALRATVGFCTAILAPGGWASDRAPAYCFDGRPRFERGRNVFASGDRETALLSRCCAANPNQSPSLSRTRRRLPPCVL